MDNENKNREHWGSRLGFILACLGSAVGLGNVWRFSTTAGENGGGAFLIVYLLIVLIIGLPVVLAEFTIGRKAQSDVVGAFEKLAPGKPWKIMGYMGVATGFIILSFYSVIAGWVMKYFFGYVTGAIANVPGQDFTSYFTSFIGQRYEPVIWQFIFMTLTIGVVIAGVKKGIEAANKLLMPLLGVLLVVLSIYSLTLGGAKEGLTFLFYPDWDKLFDPQVILAALGQAFFSLSLGMGTLITFGGYLSREHKLPSAALSVGLLDSSVAIISGVLIFPAVFAFGQDPSSGPGLVFMTLPNVFEQISAGMLVGALFFFLLFAAALSSSVSLLEVTVAYFMRKLQWSRKQTVVLIGGIIFLLGIPSSLAQGAIPITVMGRDFLTFMDQLSGNVLLPLGGVIIALFMGWAWKKEEALRDSDLGNTWVGNVWIWIVRIIAPLAILIIFLNKIGIIE
ncbi:sodium-dependent transporter [Salinibacillus xinjiangensis]|uniref:Sodium-dependent transporter n=1 Tax=Salinibacillus xinjiangensis TaxID=1229268 RepID=A0A6G1XBR4_9BACI|nr:sodium-dependent transporter [Salinibacillus xinjiangensis]MRG88345.1 sodium-dependent transporter [Salinibacillus xinjiangensis]